VFQIPPSMVSCMFRLATTPPPLCMTRCFVPATVMVTFGSSPLNCHFDCDSLLLRWALRSPPFFRCTTPFPLVSEDFPFRFLWLPPGLGRSEIVFPSSTVRGFSYLFFEVLISMRSSPDFVRGRLSPPLPAFLFFCQILSEGIN